LANRQQRRSRVREWVGESPIWQVPDPTVICESPIAIGCERNGLGESPIVTGSGPDRPWRIAKAGRYRSPGALANCGDVPSQRELVCPTGAHPRFWP